MLQSQPVVLKLCLLNSQKPRLGQSAALSRGFCHTNGLRKTITASEFIKNITVVIFLKKMNVLARNITEYITDACYDLTVKQKLANRKPSERMRKVEGPEVVKPRQPDYRSLKELFSLERRTKS